MRLDRIAQHYLLGRDVSRAYGQLLTSTVRDFSGWLGKPADTRHLRDDRVNSWLSALCAANGRSRVTISNKRRYLLTIWRAAWEDGSVELPPRRVKKISAHPPAPIAWSRVEVKRLLAAAKKVRGKFLRSKVSRANFWRALILVGYYSGLRLGDLLSLRWEDVGPRGVLLITQHKTRYLVVCRLRADAREALKALRSSMRPRILGGCLSRNRIIKQFGELAKSAGLTGGTKMLRRTGATLLEIEKPGSAMAFLGHRTPGLAYRHYVDAAQVQRHKPTPPRIG